MDLLSDLKGKGARNMKRHVRKVLNVIGEKAMNKEPGIDGILVTVGLCIIALLLCVVMKDSLAGFIRTIVTALETKANSILTGV